MSALPNILVIDDDPTVRDAFTLALEDEAYHLRAADSGEAGIALAATLTPDLVFLDLKMPGLNGVQTMRRLLSDAPHMPIYIVTAFAAEFMVDLEAARREGLAFEVAAKPLRGAQIRAIAAAVLAPVSS